MRLVRLASQFTTQKSQFVSLRYAPQKKAAYIKLTNPKKRNPLSMQVLKTLEIFFAQIQEQVKNNRTKIVILEGEGPVFSSGHDLAQLSKLGNPQIIFDECAKLMKQIRLFPSPVICVVNGIAAAAGFQMTMACDMIIASQKSVFSCPGVTRGLFCSTPGVELIRSISSQKKANGFLQFADQFLAHQAYRLGIINQVVPENKLEETVDAYVKKSLQLSTQVVAFGKKTLWEQRDLSIDEAYKHASKAMCQNIKQKQDCKEGLQAFTQKRHPHFRS